MIVLDTNVVSEPLRTSPEASVVAWLDAQHLETLYLTTITLAELRYGIAALPDGRRRHILRDQLEGETLPLFAGRVLGFDEPASRAYAVLQAAARASGRPLSVMDAMIASICQASGHQLATRNVRDFAATGIGLIDPWASAG
ncbi:PIN domain-containing protein [Mariniluteicoccus flavus]